MPTDMAAPRIELPRRYNAAVDLIERNLAAGRAGKIAFRDDSGAITYGELAERVDSAANALRGLGIEPEQRIVLCLLDTIDFPVMFLGAIKAGIVPVPINTMMAPQDYDYILRDSRARALIVSDALLTKFEHVLRDQPALKHTIASSQLARLLAAAPARTEAADTTPDDVCFWLYSSGSTGTPKGVVHLHAHPIVTAELYAKPVLGIAESDTVFGGEVVFRLWPRQFADLSDGGGCHHDPQRRAADPGAGRRHPAHAQADHLLRRADALRRDAGKQRYARTR
jgi:acyl-coenzyme A synthetase/AMP-(fatty) acid ligase